MFIAFLTPYFSVLNVYPHKIVLSPFISSLYLTKIKILTFNFYIYLEKDNFISLRYRNMYILGYVSMENICSFFSLFTTKAYCTPTLYQALLRTRN